MFLAFLMLQLPLPLSPVLDQDAQGKLATCLQTAAREPGVGETAARKWQGEGGGYLARQCLGVALANQDKWTEAAAAFEAGAGEARTAKDARAAELWAQAGNAWLAAGNPGKAGTALDTAINAGTMLGMGLGEAHLDRARVRVARADLEGAREDLDRAVEHAGADPLAWLLSATLARRMNDMPRAEKDILEALRRSPEDASVQLEAGNIAALKGDEPGARAAWARAIELAPGSPQAVAARNALGQFGAEK